MKMVKQEKFLTVARLSIDEKFSKYYHFNLCKTVAINNTNE